MLEGKAKNLYSLKEITTELKKLMDLEELVAKEFAGSGAAIGFFYISYELVRLQIMEMLNSEKNAAKKKLLI